MRKISLETVKECAKQYGFEVLDTEYVNIKEKMQFKCETCGSIINKNFTDFKVSHICMGCIKKNREEYNNNVFYNLTLLFKQHKELINLCDLKYYGINANENKVRSVLRKNGYKTYHDFCIANKIYGDRDIIINGVYIDNDDLTIEDLQTIWRLYKDEYDVILTSEICNSSKIPHVPRWTIVQKVLRKYNYSLCDFYTSMGISTLIKDIDKYQTYLEKFIQASNELGRPLLVRELLYNPWNIPDSRWFVIHCPNKQVTNYIEFLEYAGFKDVNNMTKEEVTQLIYKKQVKYNKPLMYDDFRTSKYGEVNNHIINKHWGTMNKMKEELGLEIIQEDMIGKQLSLEEAKCDITKLCDYTYKKYKRKEIITSDIKYINGLSSYDSYRKVFKQNKTTINDYIESLGFTVNKSGKGLNYTFNDGEKVVSSYELLFSTYLRDTLHLQYNKDYYRDVLYKDFTVRCDTNINCDYIIHYQNRIIYVEIAGFLRDHHKYYYENKPMKIRVKEQYRLTLMQKEQLFKDNNLEYYIIFPINKSYKSTLDLDLIDGIFNIVN